MNGVVNRRNAEPSHAPDGERFRGADAESLVGADGDAKR